MLIVDRIRQDLKAKIIKQVFRNGEFLPTFQKLAVTYATSTNSVYRAIKQLESENLVLAVRGLGTKVIYLSPSDIPKDSLVRNVGLVISEPSGNVATVQLLAGIQDGLERHRSNCIIKFSHKNKNEEHQVIMQLLRDGISDIIVAPCIKTFDEQKQYIEIYRNMNGYITFLNRYYANLPISSVGVDTYWGIYNLCNVMHEDGAQNFMFVTYELDEDLVTNEIHECTVAFHEYTRTHGLPSKTIYCPFGKAEDRFIDEDSYEVFFKHIKQPGAAVVCMSNTIALILHKIIFQRQMACPQKFYFGGIGNLNNSLYPYYEAKFDTYRLGLELAEACIAERNSSHGKRVVLDTKIIVPTL